MMSSIGPESSLSDLNPFEPPATGMVDVALAPSDASLAALEFERLTAVLNQTRPWVRFISVLLFVSCVPIGFLTILEFVRSFGGNSHVEQGVSFGNAIAHTIMIAFMFVPALYLWRYASGIREFVSTRQLLPLEEALDAQRKYWKTVGILTLLFAGLMLLAVALGVLWAL